MPWMSAWIWQRTAFCGNSGHRHQYNSQLLWNQRHPQESWGSVESGAVNHGYQSGFQGQQRPWRSLEVVQYRKQTVLRSLSWTSFHCLKPGQSSSWASCSGAESECKLQPVAYPLLTLLYNGMVPYPPQAFLTPYTTVVSLVPPPSTAHSPLHSSIFLSSPLNICLS